MPRLAKTARKVRGFVKINSKNPMSSTIRRKVRRTYELKGRRLSESELTSFTLHELPKMLKINPKTARRIIKSLLSAAKKTFGLPRGINNVRLVRSVKEFEFIEKKLREKGFKRVVGVKPFRFETIVLRGIAGGFIRIFAKGDKIIPIVYVKTTSNEINKRTFLRISAHEIGHIMADLKILELGKMPDDRNETAEMMAKMIEADLLLQNNFSKKEILSTLSHTNDTGFDFKAVETLLDSRIIPEKRREIINFIITHKLDPKFIIDYIEEKMVK